MDPVVLFERSAGRAAELARTVTGGQQALPTPCSEWDVAALMGHMAGGMEYLHGALGTADSGTAAWPDDAAVAACVEALRRPGALEVRCMSPAGFEWSVADAAAGTAMDQLVHTWDLAVALDADRTLDPELVAVIAEMFLPDTPEVGRRAGFIGPEVATPDGASDQDRLLGAMGRDPSL